MQVTYGVLLFLAGALTALVVAWLVLARWVRQARRERERLLQAARDEGEATAARLRSEAELEISRQRTEVNASLKEREGAVALQERELESSRQRQEELHRTLMRRREQLDRRHRKISETEETLERLIISYRQQMQKIAGMDSEEVKEALIDEVQRECEDEIRELKAEILGRAESDIQTRAQRLLLTAMQRLAARPHHDVTATLVTLPNEEMKGRIIGREGRNIKAFESVTGTTLLIDETPESVLISSFDPVRREVARNALLALMKDGRIHPASIEEAVAQAEDEVLAGVREVGEKALDELGLHGVHPDVVSLLGKLRYRLSNNQNSLDHSVEVASLCAMLASELGLDRQLAMRAGLFHDMGKVLGQEYAGSHAAAGARVLQAHGEDERVVNAVAAHHDEVDATSPYAALVIIADSLSATRPGARAESIDSYLHRVKALEGIARSFKGVADAYAIQAGREIRVVVSPQQIDEAEARVLVRKLRQRIEDEVDYPGSVKITVIREQRYQETAK